MSYELIFAVAAALERGAQLYTTRVSVGPRCDREGVPIAGEYRCTTGLGTELVTYESWVTMDAPRHRAPGYSSESIEIWHEQIDRTSFGAARVFVREAGESATKKALAQNDKELRVELKWRRKAVEDGVRL